MSSAVSDLQSSPKGTITNPSNASSQNTHRTAQLSVPSVETSRPLRLRLAPDAEPMMIRNDPRCLVCLNLDFNHKKGTAIISMTRSLKDLQEASESGCVYCTIICNTRKIYASEMPSGINNVCLHTDHMSPQSTRFCWRWPPGSRDTRGEISHDMRDMLLQLSLCPEAEPWGRFNKSESIPASAGSSKTINFCKDRLRECVTSHPECQPGQVILPTRLLFLGDHLSSMKIVEPYEMDFHQYAALSHCWGISKSLELRNGNEALMKESIPWDSLPQTYRDAVSVCRKLKIDYLWIDSLCIKQDDKRDWDREALKMADVFENALIVIAASCCRSTEESFLKPRTPTNCGPVVVAWNGGQESKPLLQVQKVPIMGTHMAHGMGISDPLDTRAWAFQEKRLACRFLSFTSGDVQWSCKAAFSCECPKAWGNKPGAWNAWNIGSKIWPQIVPATTEEWKSAVTVFSGLSLTYPSDKLPALSGLATRFQQKHKVNYLAGLWHNDQIIEQLAWMQDGDQISPDNEYSLAYRGPTFSWVSTNAKVIWYSRSTRTDTYIKILDAQCTLENLNPFGEVRNGYIRVQGRVVPLVLQQPLTRDMQPSLRFADGEGLGLRFILDKGTGQNYFRRLAIPPGNGVRLGRSMQWLAEATEDLPKSVSVLCLRICAFGAYMSDHFLVLVESSHVPGAYERIGLVWTWGVLTMNEEQNRLRKLLEFWESAPTEELKIV